MAKLFPSAHTSQIIKKMTPGERRFAARLLGKLEDDYLCWYDIPIGKQQVHPDFTILHPLRGLLVLEVKDWKRETLHALDSQSVTLHTDRGLVNVVNPLEIQARHHIHEIVNILERDTLLVAQSGGHKGKPSFPWGYGLVLTNISRRHFEEMELGRVWTPDRVLCQDEMLEDVDAEAFQERLWSMFNRGVSHSLTLAQIDRIRWHLYPEIRVQSPCTLDLFDPPSKAPSAAAIIPDILRVMDLQQEQLARNLGNGHRIVHGVAGSGKTLILVYRCLQLAEELKGKPILVLCFNKTLAARLQQVLHQRGVGDAVHIDHFHGWVSRQLETYQVNVPSVENNSERYSAMVTALMSGVDSGRVPGAQYAAVLVDEGHDFETDWFRLLVQMIDPEINALLLLYDDAQSIYRQRKKFSWSSVGIEAKGRTTILKVNYRNTIEILQFAYHFVADFLKREADEADIDIPLITPSCAGRHGLIPEVKLLENPQKEFDYILQWLQQRHQMGISYGDMAVLYRDKWQGEKLNQYFQEKAIPCDWLTQNKSSRKQAGSPNSLKLVTLHSSKGLEFNSVVIAYVDKLPHDKAEPSQEARLLYVGMTRATDALLLCGAEDTKFMAKLKDIDHAQQALVS